MNETKEKALHRAMQLCNRSEKCAKDIREKLSQWKVAENFHESIIADLYEGKFLDDMRYAQSYTHDKIYLSKWGRQKVYFGLKLKEIREEIIEKAVANIDEERYAEGLRELLEKKVKNVKAKSDYEKMAKLIRFGQGRGFTMSEINRALNQVV